MGRGAVWLGLLLFAVAWFVPVHEALGLSDQLPPGIDRLEGATSARVPGIYRGPHGWRACRAAWDVLTSREDRKGFESTLLGLTPLLNGVMLLGAAVAFGGGSARRARTVGGLLLVAFVWALGWLYWTDGEFRRGLQAGYWMWAASFALVGTAFLGARD
ncbi:MAG: hypothetical protein IT460_12165 [Planctomycetes bacterium]|nr:hypothetical protein [Planctomycetota bacterium]